MEFNQKTIDSIKQLISEAKTDQVIRKLDDIKEDLNSERKNEIYDIITTHNRNKSDAIRGIDTDENLQLRENKLNAEIMRFLDQFSVKSTDAQISFDKSITTKLKDLISMGKKDQVFSRLLSAKDSLHPAIYNRIIQLSAESNSLNRKNLLDIISNENYVTNSNKISFDLIRILDVLDDEEFIKTLDQPDVSVNVQEADERLQKLPEVPEALVDAIIKGDCVLYSGAGMSARANLPIWSNFVGHLISWANEHEIVDDQYSDSLLAALNERETNLVADSIISAVEEKGRMEDLIQFLKDTFWIPNLDLPSTHSMLSQIEFCAAMTTNFDLLLEETFNVEEQDVFCPQDTEALFSQFSKGDFFLLKLYGNLDRPDTVLVSPNQYEEVMADNMPFTEFMESLFIQKTILFIGSSLDGIEAYFGGLSFRRNAQMREHYALVDVFGNAWKAKAQMLKRRFGIQVLPFHATPEFPQVDTFLEELQRKLILQKENITKQEKNIPANGGVKQKNDFVSRLMLRNIGPFEFLDMELDPNWNIILGDNGVGKSTILKAIAIGIAGEEASPYADRLIRSGKTSGQIHLITLSGQEYVTTIKKKSTGGAIVKSIPGRFLQSENYLVLGFPAIRTVNWSPINRGNYTKGVNRPTTNDIIPIISGEADPRMNRLKEWIFNLDHMNRLKKDKSKSEEESYGHLLSEFFEVIGKITTGMRLEYNGIDDDNNRVLITTDDGVVPMESVSQGTSSLLGWIGVLLQRLFEIYNFKDEPRNKFALVLMDEIDAHMHPEWQQKIQPMLTKLFPNVQFVATTHSPLVVGGMDVNQVFRFERDDEGKIQLIKLNPDVTMGRTNQILTSELFGLDTTLDKKGETVQKIERYKKLYGMDREQEEELEFQEIKKELEFRIPVPADSKTEERALILIQTLLKEQIDDSFPGVQEKVIERARALFESFANDKNPR